MNTVLSIVIGLLVAYALLLLALLAVRPRGASLRESLRLLPDLLRLVRRLGADATVPRAPRIALWLLLGYLALPFDAVPDVIPVVGYADDAILVALCLRWVIRSVGVEIVRDHWPGTQEGLRAVGRLVGRRLADEPPK